MFNNIVLTGFMGAGKTSVGIGLARDLGYVFVDTDALIEADQGMTITSVFETLGEPHFREVETRIIQEVMRGEKQVISTGGGAVIREANRRAFREGGFVVCLSARPEVIYERIRRETHRPLLQSPDPAAKIRELLESRAEFYAQADVLIDTSEKSVDDVIMDIKGKITHANC
jgi:shikimate kinase